MDGAIAALDSTVTNLQTSVNTAQGEANNARQLAENANGQVETLSSQLNSLVKDLGNNFITFDGNIDITPVMQHTVQIGPLIFVHFAFKFTPTESATSLIGHVGRAPMHTHSFTLSSASPNAADMRAVVGRINSDKSIYIEYLKTDVPSGAYVFDAELFYCIDH